MSTGEIINIPREQTLQRAANALELIAIAQASNAGKIESWDAIQQVVRQGLGTKAFPVGSQLQVEHSEYGTILLDVVAHDHHADPTGHAAHSMTLLMHHCINGRMFDNTEALMASPDGLAAGTYHFTLLAGYDPNYGGGKTLEFTLTQPVPAKGVIMFPWAYNTQATATKISTYASQTTTTALETVPVTEGSGGTDLGTADGAGSLNHSYRIRYGSNNWAESAARQWLNSAAAADAWWKPQTQYDRPPSYANKAGFLNGLPADFAAVLGAVELTTARNTVYEEDGTTGGSYVTRDKIFPPSMTEVGYGKNNNIEEGHLLPYYDGAAQIDRIKYDIAAQNTARYWWLRGPIPSSANVRSVGTSGALYSSSAYHGIGLAAACVIY